MTPHRWTDVPVAPTDRRSVRRSYLIANAFEGMLAVAAVVGGLGGLLASDETVQASALGALLGGVVVVAWNVLYVTGGACVLVGLLRPSPQFEVVGLALVSGGVAANGVAIITERGWLGLTASAMYLGWAVACVVRLRLVMRLSGGRHRHDDS